MVDLALNLTFGKLMIEWELSVCVIGFVNGFRIDLQNAGIYSRRGVQAYTCLGILQGHLKYQGVGIGVCTFCMSSGSDVQ